MNKEMLGTDNLGTSLAPSEPASNFVDNISQGVNFQGMVLIASSDSVLANAEELTVLRVNNYSQALDICKRYDEKGDPIIIITDNDNIARTIADLLINVYLVADTTSDSIGLRFSSLFDSSGKKIPTLPKGPLEELLEKARLGCAQGMDNPKDNQVLKASFSEEKLEEAEDSSKDLEVSSSEVENDK